MSATNARAPQPSDAEVDLTPELIEIDATLVSTPLSTAVGPVEIGTCARLSGRYEILGLLGSGAMGCVYRARDTELNEDVALKILRSDLHAPDMLARFRQEVKLARQVTHRNVARTFDIGEDLQQGTRFLTMELLDGEPLGKLIERHGGAPVPLAEVLRMVAEVCAGLAAAHAVGVIHRDLKPDNIFICRDGRVVLTDFGIARSLNSAADVRSTTGFVGTPAYMAPEQLTDGAPVDGRTDLYALGCLMYELLTGELPFTGTSAQVVMVARLLKPPPDPRAKRPVPDRVADLVLRLMAREPVDRPQSPAAVLEEIVRVTQPAVEQPVLRKEAGVGHKTAAVLPFRNSGPAEDAYLADGLTEDLIDTLSMGAHGLKVRPRGAVLAYRDAEPRAAGHALGVQVIVEGSVRRAGALLRIQVRVISVADGFQLWARRFDRPAADILMVSDEVARAVAAALTVEQIESARGGAMDPRALDLYLRARHAYHTVDRLQVLHAVELFEQAVSISPDEPLILVGLAMARARLWFFGTEGSEARAREVAEQALRAMPGRGEPFLARAMIRFQAGDLADALLDVRQAIRRAPGLAEAYDLMGRILIETGPMDDGLNALNTAHELDPGLTQVPLAQARAQALLGRWDVAEQILGRVSEDSGGAWILRARLAVWRRDHESARQLLRHPQIQSGRYMVAAALLGVLEGRVAATSLPWPSAEDQRSMRSRAFFFQVEAEVACMVGDWDRVQHCLQRADEARLMDLMWLERCPLFDPMRRYPGFRAVREQVLARAQLVRAALTN